MWRTRRSWLFPLALLAAAAPAGAQTHSARWTLERELRIGAGAGEGALSSVSAVAVGRDGSVYVAQPEEAKVRRFGPDGRFAGAFGREGRGPGEFGNIVSMGWRGDTLWTSDPMLGRVQLFDRAGRVLGSHPLLVSSRGGLLAGGRAATTAPVATRRIAEGKARSVALLAVSREGRVLDTLRTLSVRGAALSVGAGERAMNAPNPFADHTLWGVHPDGSALVVVDRPAPASAAESRFRVTRLDPAGRAVFSREYRYTPAPVTRAHFDAVATAWSDGMREAASRGGGVELVFSPAQLRGVLGAPRFHPPVSHVVAGRDGTVWLRREDWRQARVTWNVLDARGTLLGFFDLPSAVQIVQADLGAVWAVERDADDVPHVVRYRVRRAAAPAS